MIEDALAGKIDLIVTKSISRFARNTIDTLTTVRQLKEKDIEVFLKMSHVGKENGLLTARCHCLIKTFSVTGAEMTENLR